MNWRAHLLIGAATGVSASFFLALPPSRAFEFAAVCSVSSLLPDLDIRSSKASGILSAVLLALSLAASYALSFLRGGGLFQFAFYFAAISIALLLLDYALRPRHRGIMHSFPFAFAVFLIFLFAFGGDFPLAFLLGYSSHLVADAMH